MLLRSPLGEADPPYLRTPRPIAQKESPAARPSARPGFAARLGSTSRARKTHKEEDTRPSHTKAEIKALAASIAALCILQNPEVEPEIGPRGKPTGHYLVNADEPPSRAIATREAQGDGAERTDPLRSRHRA